MSQDAPKPKVTLKLNQDAFDAQLILTTNDGQEIDLGPLLHIHEINLKVKAGHQHNMTIECTSLGDIEIQGDAPVDRETIDQIKRQLDFICPPEKEEKKEPEFALEYEAQFMKKIPELGDLAACGCGRSAKVIQTEISATFGARVRLECVCQNPTLQDWPNPKTSAPRTLKRASDHLSGVVSHDYGDFTVFFPQENSRCLPLFDNLAEKKAEKQIEKEPSMFESECVECSKTISTPYKLSQPICGDCAQW